MEQNQEIKENTHKTKETYESAIYSLGVDIVMQVALSDEYGLICMKERSIKEIH